jgi:predicted phosphohydrolase
MSDLHFEFRQYALSEYFDIGKNVDVVVIAGDLAVAKMNARMLEELALELAPTPLLYIPGNHDFYHGSKPSVHRELTKLDILHDNFHFMCRKTIVIDDVAFIGATGWQDNPEFTMLNYELMNDFHLIKKHDETVLKFGRDDKKYIVQSLITHKHLKRVVITHLLPTRHAVNWNTPEVTRKGKYINAYFNNWDDILHNHTPDFWICGHCHDSFLDIVHETMIVRNAFGYAGSERQNLDFEKYAILYIK